MKEKRIARDIAVSAMLIALAMIFSYVESLLPISFGVPGIKLGLANLVILMGLYLLNPWKVLWILVARILLSGLMFGNMAAILYSLCGGLLSFFVMLVLKKGKVFSMTGVSIAGAVSHNIGQLFVAMLVVQNTRLIYYGPVLMLAGALAGSVIGIIGHKCKNTNMFSQF